MSRRGLAAALVPLLCLQLCLCFGPSFGQTEPKPDLVANFAGLDHLEFKGVKAFSPTTIKWGLAHNFSFWLASNSSVPLEAYLLRLRELIATGYRNAGFRDVKVDSLPDRPRGKILIAVEEGEVYRWGEIHVRGLKKIPEEAFRAKFRSLLMEPKMDQAQLNEFLKAFLQPAETNRVAIVGALPNLAPMGSALSMLSQFGGNALQPPASSKPLWQPGGPAQFENNWLLAASFYLTNAFYEFSYFSPRADLKIVTNNRQRIADLQANVSAEGEKAAIKEIALTGNLRNTRSAILDYLKISPEMDLTKDLTNQLASKLYESARFMKHDVRVAPLSLPGQYKLILNLVESEDVPRLRDELSPADQALLKSRAWFLRHLKPGEAKEDLVFSFEQRSSKAGWPKTLKLEAILAARGAALLYSTGEASESLALRYGVFTGSNLFAIFSPGRHLKYEKASESASIEGSLSYVPIPDRDDGRFNFSFSYGFRARSETNQPMFDLKAELAPVAFLAPANSKDATVASENGNIVLRSRADTNTLTRFNAREGGPISVDFSYGTEHPGRLVIESKSAAFDDAFQKTKAACASDANAFNPQASLTSFLTFVAPDLWASAVKLNTVLPEDWKPKILADVSAFANGQRAAQMFLAGRALLKMDFHEVFAPWQRLNPERFEGVLIENMPEFPIDIFGLDPASAPNVMGKILALLCFTQNDFVAPGSDGAALARAFIFIQGSQRDLARKELQTIAQSSSAGPLTLLAAAKFANLAAPELTRDIARKGFSRLTADYFVKDCAGFLVTNTILRQTAERAGIMVAKLTEAELDAIAAILPAPEAEFLQTWWRGNREPKSLVTAIEPALAKYWKARVEKIVAKELGTVAPDLWEPTEAVDQFQLGRQLLPQNSAKGLKWIRAAAEQGYAFAQYALGSLSLQSAQSAEQESEAIKWLLKAADQNFPEAQAYYGWFLARKATDEAGFKEAIEWFRRAAEKGDAQGRYFLANCYQTGQGVSADLAQAIHWFEQAADKNHAEAQFQLGLIYLQGKGVPPDDEKALNWFRNAANNGHAAAQANLGWMYQNRRAVPLDYIQAYKWYKLASAGNNPDAAKYLEKISSNMRPEEIEEGERRAAIFSTAHPAGP